MTNERSTGPSRRNNEQTMTEAELAIHRAVYLVESLGADPRLTDAVCLLEDARGLVADYVDGVPHDELAEASEEARNAVIAAAIRSSKALDAMVGGHKVTDAQATEYSQARLGEAVAVSAYLVLCGDPSAPEPAGVMKAPAKTRE